jgi:hypothetical protein
MAHCTAGPAARSATSGQNAFAVPAVAIAFGWQSIFGDRIFAVSIVDYLFAYVFGNVFQYFTIAPVRRLSVARGIIAAVKADTLSLTAWQVGMYGFMAIAYLVIFRRALGATLTRNSSNSGS